MPLRTFLVPAATGVDPIPRLDVALALARRFGGHVEALHVRPDPAATNGIAGDAMLGAAALIDAFEREGREAAVAARAAFDAWRGRRGLPDGIVDHRLDSVFASWRERVGDLERLVTRRGRLCDLIVADRPDGRGAAAAEVILDAAVFGTGRPVLVTPAGRIPADEDLLRHVVVAWNGSLEATHAVAGALPVLREAERVSVFVAPPRREGGAEEDEAADLDLAEALHWHGIRARRAGPEPGPTGSVGEALLAAAARLDATMIVMGAYTHSRVRQMLLGGVTRHVLSHATMPVIFAH